MKTLSEELNGSDLSEVIAENFGANATYVEGLLSRYRSNPSLVDDAWRAYFAELLGEPTGDGSGGNGGAAWPAARTEDGGAAQSQWPTGVEQQAVAEWQATQAQAAPFAAEQ